MKTDTVKILVVDDETGMREGIRRILGARNYAVETAGNGREGIHRGTSMEYDLYLIDLKMPDHDGTEVLRKIRETYPEAICVIMTAFASIDTAVETTQLGAYHYIAKPFTPDELRHLVDRALERRWYILEARRLREEERRRMLEVAHEKSRSRTIINSIDDGILVVNQQGELVLHNPRFLQLLNLSGNVKSGQPILHLLPESMAGQLREILEGGNKLKALRQEIVIEPPARLVVMVNMAPVLDEQGNLLGVVSVLRDISELKQLELLKSQFVNMVAHELKAPLAAINGYIDMVVNRTLGDEPETYEKYLNRSLQRSEALMALINDLLNISRLEAGKVRREIERVNLGKVVEEITAFFLPQVQKRNLSVSLDAGEAVFIDADREEIRRVFTNLLSNAIKYNVESGSIRISVRRDGPRAEVVVGDSGIGMKPDEKARLFEEFFRAKNTKTRYISGTGLGLSLVKKIVESYAGNIGVESEYGSGSRFTVTFPLPESGPGPAPEEDPPAG